MASSAKYKLILLLLMLWCINACKKKIVPTGDAGIVAFYFDGTINGQIKKLEAGKANNFMHTNFYNSTDNILNFEGQIGQTTNPNNSEYLKIIFKNYTGSNNPNVDSMFTIGDFNSLSLDTNTTISVAGKTIQFTYTGIAQNVTSYLWTFGDGQTSTLANPYHVYTKFGKVSVSCLVMYGTGQQDFLQNDIDVSNGNTCNAQCTITKLGGDSLLCTGNGGSGNYSWALPNGTTQTGNNIKYTAPITLRDYIKCTDLGTCASTYKQVVAPANSVALVNYTYVAEDTNFTQTIIPNTNYKKIIVEYYDGTKKYVSFKKDNSLQQSNKKIISIQEKNLYQKNNAGMRTIKLRGEIGTYLYNVANNSDSIFVYSNRLQLAVAFP